MARVVGVGTEALSSGGFAPAPVGTRVKATVHEIEETTVKSGPNAGKPQGVVSVKVQQDFIFNGPDGKPQNLKGREIRYNNIPFYAGGNNEWVLGSFAQAVGWEVDEKGNISIPETDELYQTQGREVVVKLGIRTNERDGNQYNTVAGWLPAGAKTTPSAGGSPAAGGAPSVGAENLWG